MIIDNKGRLFGKVSIIDILIVLIILATAAGIGSKFIKAGGSVVPGADKKDKIIITFYGDEVPKFTAEKVAKGQLVKETVKNSAFGPVTEFKVGESETYIVNSNTAEIVRRARDDSASLYVTCEADGIWSPNGVTIDNAEHYIGQSLNLKIGNTAFYIKVFDIKKKE